MAVNSVWFSRDTAAAQNPRSACRNALGPRGYMYGSPAHIPSLFWISKLTTQTHAEVFSPFRATRQHLLLISALRCVVFFSWRVFNRRPDLLSRMNELKPNAPGRVGGHPSHPERENYP